MNISSASRGNLCFTFDDRNFNNWIKFLPIWQKYDARATFFVSGKVDEVALETMKTLQHAGHSVGLHALHHAKYPSKPERYIDDEILPQLEVCRKNGIKIRAFAYPYSLRDEESDRTLFEYFDFLRGGAWQIFVKGVPPVENDRLFVGNIAEKQLFYGVSVCGNFDFHQIRQCFLRAAEANETIAFYAHDIPDKLAATHHISVGQLEVLLKLARALNMNICGMNEL